MIFSGEVTAAGSNGLFSPVSFITLFLLYFVLFHLLESLITKYSLTIFQLVLITFVIYSVGITGFFHGEIANFVLDPKNNPITFLMRIQSSLFTVFAFYLLNRFFPRQNGLALKPGRALFLTAAYLAVLSFTGEFGAAPMIKTLRTAPLWSIIFMFLALFVWRKTFNIPAKRTPYNNFLFEAICYIFLILELIPQISVFILMLAAMPITAFIFLSKPEFRNSQI